MTAIQVTNEVNFELSPVPRPLFAGTVPAVFHRIARDPRQDIRVFRLSRIRGKVSYSSKAEHDFARPEDFDHRWYATRTDWQLGEPQGQARIWLSNRVDWLIERHYGHAGTLTIRWSAASSWSS